MPGVWITQSHSAATRGEQEDWRRSRGCRSFARASISWWIVGYGVIAILEEDIAAFLGMLIIYAVSLPAVIGAFLACSFLWLGFNDRLRIVGWKLAGITCAYVPAPVLL